MKPSPSAPVFQKTARRALLLVIPAMIIMVILADRNALPGFILDLIDTPNMDKVLHFLLMGGLAFVLMLALPAHWQIGGILILTAVIGLEEISQSLFPERSSSLEDFAASTLGVLALGGLAIWLSRRSSRLKKA
ncbi:MAG TPA: hypothetical protein PKW33_09360 [Anaerolineaceae bacterium]|nr:hypothetical protein [Anaerolineaceae bacterium]HPN51783.1 hypothetical protein [Anaerolineaceae bacterium]